MSTMNKVLMRIASQCSPTKSCHNSVTDRQSRSMTLYVHISAASEGGSLLDMITDRELVKARTGDVSRERQAVKEITGAMFSQKATSVSETGRGVHRWEASEHDLSQLSVVIYRHPVHDAGERSPALCL